MKITTKTAHMRITRKGFTLVELLVVIAIIAALAGVSYGPIMNQINSADRSEALSNGKSINVALLAYYSKNREYPREDVASAEDAFNLLINSGEVNEEKYFWNKSNAKQGFASLDGVDNDGTLTADENVWGYNQDLDAGDGSSPIIFDACESADATAGTATFNTAVWGGQAIIVRVDGSAESENIDFTGAPLDENGDGKTGSITEERGGQTEADIFAILSDSVTSYTTTGS